MVGVGNGYHVTHIKGVGSMIDVEKKANTFADLLRLENETRELFTSIVCGYKASHVAYIVTDTQPYTEDNARMLLELLMIVEEIPNGKIFDTRVNRYRLYNALYAYYR